MDSIEVADVLERAADVLFVRGRSRHFTVAADGRVCVRGALGVAADGEPWSGWEHTAANKAACVLSRFVCARGEVLTQWNARADDDTVLDAMRLCAKELRNGELEL